MEIGGVVERTGDCRLQIGLSHGPEGSSTYTHTSLVVSRTFYFGYAPVSNNSNAITPVVTIIVAAVRVVVARVGRGESNRKSVCVVIRGGRFVGVRCFRSRDPRDQSVSHFPFPSE